MQLSDRIGRRMKLQDLHILMTVVQAGSMNKAATLLNTAQPAVSRSIADLEYALGVPLLDRRQHGVEPTEYGHALLDRCVTVFDELRQGVKSIEHLADPTAGEVRFGCHPFLAAGFVSAVVERVSRRYPRIVFHIVGEAGDQLYRELYDRNVDFSQTVDLLQRLRMQKVHVEELIFPDEIHGFLMWKSWIRAYGATEEFFARELK